MVKTAVTRKSTIPSASSIKHSVVVNTLIFIGVLYLFGWQLHALSGSLTALRQANGQQIVAALLATIMGFGAAALSYQVLALRPLQFRVTLGVQIASGFVNRLLPAGLGSLGLFALYYRKYGHSLVTSSALVVTNNILGFVSSALLLTVVLILRPEYVGRLHVNGVSAATALVVVSIAGLCMILARRSQRLLGFLRKLGYGKILLRFTSFIWATLSALQRSLRPTSRTFQALVCNMIVTSLNVVVLSLAVSSIGGVLDWPSALIVLSIGTLVGAAVPTPGGIGGVETGLLAGMLTFGVSSSVGLAAVLLYRGLTYWLPIVPGIVMFRIIERRYL